MVGAEEGNEERLTNIVFLFAWYDIVVVIHLYQVDQDQTIIQQ